MSFVINGKELPAIAIGTWAWGSSTNGSKMVFGSKSNPEALKESFDIAFKSGFTLFDTAAVYGMGNSEKILAEFADGKDFIFSDKYTPLKKFSPEKVDNMYSESVEKFNGRIPDIYWLQLIYYTFLTFILWTMWSLFSALLAAISKDFGNLVKSFVTAVFWLSGILWDPETVKIPWLKKALVANPVTYIVNGYRQSLINKIWFWEQPKRIAYFLISCAVMLILALWAYRKVRKDIPDVL